MDTARRRAISEVGPRPQVKPTKNDVAGEQQKGVQQTRTQTECACAKSNDHYPKVVMDQVFDCTIEEVYNLLYHGDFIRKFLEDQKNTGTYAYKVMPGFSFMSSDPLFFHRDYYWRVARRRR